jgi:hypothetical protein
MKIKVCICAAYDWMYLQHSLPFIYSHADSICISLDKDRISWSGNSFSFDKAAFARFIKEIDKENKVVIYEDNFHLPELLPIENECRQRLLMTQQLGKGGWFLQIDADEYYLYFKELVSYLRDTRIRRNVNITCPFIELYKKNDEGFFLVDAKNSLDLRFMPIATNAPKYEYGRVNGYFNIKTNFFALHNTLARSFEEVKEKINNWGHSHEVNKEAIFSKWNAINKDNFHQYKDFNPLTPAAWPALRFVEAGTIDELAQKIKKNNPYSLSRKKLLLENSLFVSRSKSLFKKFF